MEYIYIYFKSIKYILKLYIADIEKCNQMKWLKSNVTITYKNIL